MRSIFQSNRCEWVFSRENSVWQKRLKKRVQERDDHIWLLSSGTSRTNGVKAIAHTKNGFLIAAQAANKHLQVVSTDIWLNVLPTHHVGGLAIHARASLSGAKVIEPNWQKWSAKEFAKLATKAKATLSSLVPTQVYDLVAANIPAPMSLRAVVVGGGPLANDLYLRGRKLGWPLLPSYGLTECGSQVATASLHSLNTNDFPWLEPLEHVQLRTQNGFLQIQSKSVCEWVCTLNISEQFTMENPAPRGWLTTEDQVELNELGLEVRGRQGDLVKVLGVLVNLSDVEQRIRELAQKSRLVGNLAVLPGADPRKGHGLILVTDSRSSLKNWQKLKNQCNKKFSGPERIDQLYWVEKIPLSDIGKVKKAELLSLLGL